MESLPTSVVFQMIRGKKADATYKLKFKEKSYQFSVFTFTKTDIAKIYRVEGTAALYVGSFIQKGKEFDLHAKSMSIEQIKATIKENPIVGVLSVAKGTNDEGGKRFVAVITLAYNDANLLQEAKKESLRRYLKHGKNRDGQVQKLYKWEGKELLRLTKTKPKKMKMSEINAMAKRVIAHYNLPSDKIHISNAGTKSESRLGVCKSIRDDMTSDDPNFVILHIHDSTVDTLLHEMAHMIVSFKFKRSETQSHGAEFCGVYATLLSYYYDETAEVFLESMSSFGLKTKKFVGPSKKLDLNSK